MTGSAGGGAGGGIHQSVYGGGGSGGCSSQVSFMATRGETVNTVNLRDINDNSFGRAYSLLEIKAVKEDQRIIQGIATTPEPDRMGDVVEPTGVKFTNPMPLLWQHRSDQPVGIVSFDKPTKKGVTFEAKLPNIQEPGNLKDRVDEAWQSVKAGLVRGVSIGFRSLESSIMKDGGIRFIETEVMELSLVTIPANADATIQVVKAIDASVLAASGQEQRSISNPAGVTAKKQTTNVTKAKSIMKKSIAEQIAGFEATRLQKSERMGELMDLSAEESRTLDQAEREEYDTLEQEIADLDEHIKRLKRHEQVQKLMAVPVEAQTQKAASDSRAGVHVQVLAKKLPPGIPFTRYVMALAKSQGNRLEALEIAKGNAQWQAESPEVAEVLKAAVNAGTTTDATWAGPLVNYQIMTQEFIDYLRPLTVIGRIPGLRRVPFKVKIPRQTGAASVNWVGEGKVKPLTSIAFDTITMDFAKIAGIIPLTEELVRFSNPSAEALVREELARAIVQFMDQQFLDPTKAANDVSPASITNGVTPTTATGTTAAAFRADVKTVFNTFISNNYNTANLVWIMTQQQALALSLMVTSLGNPLYPGINLNGGTLAGLPVVTSESVPSTGGSPTDGYAIILVNASDILLADDGQVTIDASREASLQMDSTPDSPPTASTVLVSLWQHNMVGIKAERYINWAKARSTAVQFIQNAKYAE